VLASCSGMSLCICFAYFFTISIHVLWKFISKLLIWTLFSVSAIVRVVGECMQAAVFICVSVVEPPYLAIMYFVKPL
jgi:hypothetical protein